MKNEIKISAVVVAAGSGSRFGGERPKQLTALAGRPLLSHCLATLDAMPEIDEIILVLPAGWRAVIEAEAVRPFGFAKVAAVNGGDSRAASSRLGFAAARGGLVLVHDGARPLVSAGEVRAVVAAAEELGAAILAQPSQDTLKLVEAGAVVGGLDRNRVWRAQTPQAFRREVLAEALAGAEDDGQGQATDEATLVERLGRPVAVVPGSARNLKVTTPEDLALAENFLKASPRPRVGQGYDVHRLVPGRPLFLGCVEVPFELGLLGHSDADVMAHALGDAILGAAGLGDIGLHFSDKDPRWAGLSGARLLAGCMAKVRALGLELVNADVTLIGERPKIAPHRQAMIAALAAALGAPPAAVNVKATTTEGLGATGRGEGLAAIAIAALLG